MTYSTKQPLFQKPAITPEAGLATSSFVSNRCRGRLLRICTALHLSASGLPGRAPCCQRPVPANCVSYA